MGRISARHMPGYVDSSHRLGGSQNRTPLVYIFWVLGCLIGPTMTAAYFLDTPGDLDGKLFLGIGGPVLSLIAPFYVVPNIRRVAALRARARKLRDNGIPAIARVTDRIDLGLDEGTNMGLTMHFTGSGVEPFIASVECNVEDDVVVGTRLNALVDPSDNQFRILRR